MADRTPAGKKQKGKQAIRAAVKTAATYVGLSVEQIRTQLQAGKSLAEIATAQGKSVDGLKAAIVTDAKAAIAKLVSSGKITAERGSAVPGSDPEEHRQDRQRQTAGEGVVRGGRRAARSTRRPQPF